MDRHKTRRRCRAQTTLPYQPLPRAQQIWINVVPRRNRPHAGARLVRLSNYRSFSSTLQRRRRSRALIISIWLFDIALRSTLRWALRSTASACPVGSKQGGAHRTITERPAQHQANPQGHACLQRRAKPGREGRGVAQAVARPSRRRQISPSSSRVAGQLRQTVSCRSAGLRVGTSITEGTANFQVNRHMNKSQ
jgi:hypothetical protein